MSEQKVKAIEMGATKTAEKKKKPAASGGHGDAYSGAISNRAIQKKKTRLNEMNTKRGLDTDTRTSCQRKTDSSCADWGKPVPSSTTMPGASLLWDSRVVLQNIHLYLYIKNIGSDVFIFLVCFFFVARCFCCLFSITVRHCGWFVCTVPSPFHEFSQQRFDPVDLVSHSNYIRYRPYRCYPYQSYGYHCRRY